MGRAPSRRVAALAFAAVCAMTTLGCVDPEPVENVLEDLIGSLNQNSSDWQRLVQDSIDKLSAESQAAVRVELQNLVSRSVAQGGVEIRCNADFVGHRVKAGVERTLARLRNKPVPPSEPVVCLVVPEVVDTRYAPDRTTHISFYGYDFDHEPRVRAFMERSGGSGIDVSSKVTVPTHYLVTLPLGSDGADVNRSIARIALRWKDKTLSTIAVVHPLPPCRTVDHTFRPGAVTHIPEHRWGDRDFYGHGPRVTTRITLRHDSTQVFAEVYMKAQETGGGVFGNDNTTAESTKTFPLSERDPAWRIDAILSTRQQDHSFTDSDHARDEFSLGSGDVANKLIYIGDTDGSESGTETSVTVHFNPIRSRRTQIRDCDP